MMVALSVPKYFTEQYMEEKRQQKLSSFFKQLLLIQVFGLCLCSALGLVLYYGVGNKVGYYLAPFAFITFLLLLTRNSKQTSVILKQHFNQSKFTDGFNTVLFASLCMLLFLGDNNKDIAPQGIFIIALVCAFLGIGLSRLWREIISYPN